MPLIERTAGSLSEIFREAKAIRDGWNPDRDAPEEIWFRGQAKRSYSLLPGLYRPETLDLGYDELAMFHSFVNLGLTYATQRPSTDWEWYFIAQHHGLPTRLLDWTESLLAATYFAVEAYWRTLDKRNLYIRSLGSAPAVFDDESPTIWVTDAGSINLFSQKEDAVFVPKDQIKAYLPRFLGAAVGPGDVVPEWPIALYPPRQTPRIVAQQGMFTLHGRNKTSLDTSGIASQTSSEIKLGCIQLDRSRLASLVDELMLAGVTRLTLFPDLDSVATHIKWQYRD